MSNFQTVTDRTLIDKVIAVVAPLAPWRLPLLRAARDGIVVMIEIPRDADLRAKDMDSIRRPIVVVVSDDDEASTGPSRFPSAHHLVTWWAKAAIIHAAAGEEIHYQAAVANALLHRRLLFVETSSAHAEAWGDLIQPRRIPTLAILPRGGVHPVAPKREDVQ